jgi:hypothetical protein
MDYPNLKGDMTDCLMGNLHQDFEPRLDAVTNFMEVPAPLSHGMPLIPEEARGEVMDHAADRQPA